MEKVGYCSTAKCSGEPCHCKPVRTIYAVGTLNGCGAACPCLSLFVIASQCAHWRGNPFLPLTQGVTDSHDSDVGHCLGMTEPGFPSSREKRPSRRDGLFFSHTSRDWGRPKLTAMAASTRSITSLSTCPIRWRRRCLSSVRTCSSRITDSLGRPYRMA